MRQIIVLTAAFLSLFGLTESPAQTHQSNRNDVSMNSEIRISIGDTHYTATLEDNSTARAFAALLPVTVTMTEMNGNEKYYNLSGNLPANPFRPGTIHAGDLLLWGTNTVVLFYETFSSGYSYTRLGEIADPDGLAATLGRGNVKVTFSPQ
ncbi:cyclophilin-like fold protein [uncultured Odoribacter sp.]|uniref:cyclophilin-like fold protein n=1 Tax=uncultured Odoribacter sp. TaxID=876416 RepID=UPI00261F3F77|nr:cyclophilin-like fold protein [uncultured Odoribacter sp.]